MATIISLVIQNLKTDNQKTLIIIKNSSNLSTFK